MKWLAYKFLVLKNVRDSVYMIDVQRHHACYLNQLAGARQTDW